MPALTNTKHERFAQARAMGKTADDAYAAAGYAPNRGNASRLKTNESILNRVAELQSKGAKRTLVTIESITDELEEARAKAMEGNQVSAAVSATMGKARINGLIIDKKQLAGPRGGPLQVIDVSKLKGMTDEQLALLERTLIQIGLSEEEDQDEA